MKKFSQCISYGGERCDLEHYDFDNLDQIEDELVEKVHAVCWMDGKILLVNHPEWNIWSIPGGTRENGESVEEAMKREIAEETNCNVEKCVPISYQKILLSDGSYRYYVQYFCKVSKIGEFEYDVAGNIDKIEWIVPEKYAEYIENKPFKHAVLERVVNQLDIYENI